MATTSRAEQRSLPEFPWDRLLPFKERAAAQGLIDLSIGTPVDATPSVVQEALRAAADSPGYPTVWGTPALRSAIAGWLQRRLGVSVADADILPTMGSKELVAMLPFQLALGASDVIAIPAVAYPTYDLGARLVGAAVATADGVGELEALRMRAGAGGRRLSLAWLNSPSNPSGAVLGTDQLREIVAWGRAHDVLIVNDECYIEFGWDCEPRSVLHPEVCGTADDAHRGLLAVHSLSKRSNLAGYRGAFITGDRMRIQQLLEVRKHSGFMVPTPVQAAMAVAYGDDAHVATQRERYARRRALLRPALEAAGFRVDHSHAGLYLWATRGEDCWLTIGRLADLGLLAAPGAFYGPAGEQHVRIALTASDADIATAAVRLAQRHILGPTLHQ
ncbi:MAG: succinyldiaminopimelate transaminase [Candidatus Nanopelagicales bacterium]